MRGHMTSDMREWQTGFSELRKKLRIPFRSEAFGRLIHSGFFPQEEIW